jgi:hypothetical protein
MMLKHASTGEEERFPKGSLWIEKEWKGIVNPSERREFIQYNWCCVMVLEIISDIELSVLLEDGNKVLWYVSTLELLYERI